jgi:hypothetical protein
MQKYISKNAMQSKSQKEKRTFKSLQNKTVKRFENNATRLGHSNVRNKNKSKKG